MPGRNTVDKFWARVDKQPDGCWEWQGCRTPKNYGVFGIKRKHWLAHRFAFYHAVGPFDPSLLVCHKCDNPPCVNPDHLFLGTQLDNIQDCLRKGRHWLSKRVNDPNPHGFAAVLCECGCGQETPRAIQTNRKIGVLKGQPRRFVAGHNRMYGRAR
jgi:hypothetical protein